jgi:hypothetical protein
MCTRRLVASRTCTSTSLRSVHDADGVTCQTCDSYPWMPPPPIQPPTQPPFAGSNRYEHGRFVKEGKYVVSNAYYYQSAFWGGKSVHAVDLMEVRGLLTSFLFFL